MIKKTVIFAFMLACSLLTVACTPKKKQQAETSNPKLMWFDATANFERFNHKDSIDFYLEKISALGFTDAVVDMRPISGHVLYKSEYAPNGSDRKSVV